MNAARTAGPSTDTADDDSTDAASRPPTPKAAHNNSNGNRGGGGGGGGGGSVPARRRRGFRPAVLTKLQAARLWIIHNRPYYCRALLACPLIPAEGSPSMSIAMDHRWRIYINEDFVETLTVEETATTLIHEVNHALRGHGERGRRTAPDALDSWWRMACELEINDDLHNDGLSLDGWMLPEMFDLDAGHTAETYFVLLLGQAAAIDPAAIDDVPDCGPVCSGHSTHNTANGGSDTAGDGLDGDSDGVGVGVGELQGWLLRQAVAKAIVADAARGDKWVVPAGLRAWAHDTAASSRTNWRQILARVLRQSRHTTAGGADYTWGRPPRRHDPHDDIIRPGLAAPTGDITVVLDTSGSMSGADHARAFAEVDAVLKKVVPGEAIRVLSVDDEVHTDQRVVQSRQIVPVGGRGTDMCAGITAAAQRTPAAIIVITDGYTPWPRNPLPGARNVIAALTSTGRVDQVPGWIQAIDISDPDPDDDCDPYYR